MKQDTDGKKLGTSEGPASPAGDLQQLKVADLVRSPTQPRKHFDATAMEELTGSVKLHGIVQPLIVRRQATTVADGMTLQRFEIVSGERRQRAALALKLETVPCLVRTLTDGEVMEIQTIENLQRKDLHPMEEARGYEQLMKQCKLTVEQVAAKTGKKPGYIDHRLRLCHLVPEAEKLFLENLLDVSTASLVARIPVKDLQAKAAVEVSGVKDRYDKTPMRFRQAAEHIKRNYMLRLADAPFKTNDASLCSKAGTCANCPKRTGKDRTLFDEVPKNEDLCTDPVCFAEKKNAQWQKTKLAALAKGQTVLDEKESATMFFDGGSLKNHKQFVDANEHCYEDPKCRNYGKVVAKVKDPVPVVLARDRNGGIHELMPADRVAKALEAAGVKTRAVGGDSAEKWKADQRRARERAKLGQAAGAKALVAIRAAAEKRDDLEAARFLTLALVRNTGNDACREVTKARGLEFKAGNNRSSALEKVVEKATAAELRGLCAELLAVGYALYGQFGSGYSTELRKACTFYGVNLKKIEGQVKAELAAKKKGKAKKPAAAAKG